MYRKLIPLMIFIFAVSYSACKREMLTPQCDGSIPYYNVEVKPIIDANCATRGCHDDGSKDGDFTTYAGMASVISNGTFKDAVLIRQTMPKRSVLAQADIDILQCWAETAYREK